MNTAMLRAKHPNRWPSRLVACSGLLLFLGGSNFCLLAALGGMPMSCLATPVTAAAPASHCGHGAPASHGADRSDTGASSRCCVNLAPAPAPQPGKADALHRVALQKPHSDIAAPVVLTIVRTPRDSDESPPLPRDVPAPSLGRAPPLS